MSNQRHLAILHQGAEAWNQWRRSHRNIQPDLTGAEIKNVDLCKINLSHTTLKRTYFFRVNLSEADLSNTNLTETRFASTDLSGSNLCKAMLTEISLRDEDLSKANLSEADLSKAFLFGTILKGANLSKANLSNATLSFANLAEANLSGANLRGANLSQARLNKADLSFAFLGRFIEHGMFPLDHERFGIHEAVFLQLHRGANLVRADLSDATLLETNLSNADLVQTNFTNADLTGANLYGTARDGWIIEAVKCNYVFFDVDGKNRIPKDRDFRPVEFEDLYKQLPTFEYIFTEGFAIVDAIVMSQVVQDIDERKPEIELRIDSFSSRGGLPRAIFTVIHKKYAEEALRDITYQYEKRIKFLEGKNEQLLDLISLYIDKPQFVIDRINIRRLTMGDSYNVSGQAGAVGPNAHVHDINFTQIGSQIEASVDLSQLADELSRLRQAMKKESTEAEQDIAVSEVAKAEQAAKAKNASFVLS